MVYISCALNTFMLNDTNGRPYRAIGSLQQFDPENSAHDLFQMWDQEVIKIGGSPLFYYEVFIPPATIDPMYRESRGKMFSNFPVQLWGIYEPVTSENQQNMFGIDSPTEMVFELNIRDTLARVGHLPKIGSRIYTPHKRENWKIIQRGMGEFKLWGELRLQLICERFQDDIITNAGRVKQQEPDFKLH